MMPVPFLKAPKVTFDIIESRGNPVADNPRVT
jgi:hypothetical protein